MQGIYLILTITDPHQALDLLHQVVDTGITAVQLRAKSGIDFLCARALRQLCQAHDVLCIVNDDVSLALAIDADGVHLGQSDMPLVKARKVIGPDKILGSTAPTPALIKQAVLANADYVGVGHVFPTTTKKKDGPPIGIAGIQTAVKSSPLPVVAIGGLHAGVLQEIRLAGALSAAICAAIVHAPDPRAAALHLVTSWHHPTFQPAESGSHPNQ